MDFNKLIGESSRPLLGDVVGDVGGEVVVVGFTHGRYISIKVGMYKGLSGYVSEMLPGGVILMRDGYGYTDVNKYGLMRVVKSKLQTEYGESVIEGIIKGHVNKRDVIKLCIYKDGNKLRLVEYVRANVDKVLVRELKESISDVVVRMPGNKRFKASSLGASVYKSVVNSVVVDLPIEMLMDEMNVGDGNMKMLLKGLSEMYISGDKSMRAPVELMENLSGRVRVDSDFVDMLNRRNFGNNNSYEINRLDIIEIYYLVYSGIDRGWYGVYKPYADQYYVKYTSLINTSYSSVELLTCKEASYLDNNIKCELGGRKLYGLVKSGVYKNEVLKIKGKKFPTLGVILSCNGQYINEIIVLKEDNSGVVIRDKYIKTPIYPKDVFYYDLILKNGHAAEVVSIDNGVININELVNNEIIGGVIKYDDIQELTHDFKFGGIERVYKRDDVEYIEGVGVGVDDIELESGFKDKSRLNYTDPILSDSEREIKRNIMNVLRVCDYNDSDINVYDLIDSIESFVNKINKVGASFYLTNNIKYIVVCYVYYDLIKNVTNINFGDYLKMLYKNNKSFFTKADFSVSALNDYVFLDLINDRRVLIDDINRLIKQNEYMEVLKLLIRVCNEYIQKSEGININLNIKSNILDIKDLIKVNNYRYKLDTSVNVNPNSNIDQSESQVFSVGREHIIDYKRTFIVPNDLLKGEYPDDEINIFWAGRNKDILNSYKEILRVKGKNKIYKYVMDNLHRGPYGVNGETNIKLKKYYDTIYKKLIVSLNESKLIRELKIESLNKEKVNLMNKRKQIFDEDPDSESGIPVVNDTGSYLREKAKRLLKKSIIKGSISASKNAKKGIRYMSSTFMVNNTLGIPEDEITIEWSVDHKKIMDDYIKSIKSLYENESKESKKGVYKYIIENLKRGPYMLKGSEFALDSKSFKYIKRVYEHFLQKVPKNQ